MSIPKLIFIVPYKNRETEKLHFSIYMKYLMEDYNKQDYEIYYLHQTDNRPFNRGATKNIGFLIMKKKYPNDYKNITFVFNDLDTLPIKKNILDYETKKNEVKHFYGFKYALGGIFSIKGEDFEKINGFPNNWGWGLEDNAINNRVIQNKMTINRDNFYLIRSNEFFQNHNSNLKLVNNSEPGKYLNNQLKDNLNTITGLDYKIEKNIEICNDNNTNDYMININQFYTLVDPKNEKFYQHDINKSNRLKVDKLNLNLSCQNRQRMKMFR